MTETEKQEGGVVLPSADTLPKMPMIPELGQAKATSLKLYLSVPSSWSITWWFPECIIGSWSRSGIAEAQLALRFSLWRSQAVAYILLHNKAVIFSNDSWRNPIGLWHKAKYNCTAQNQWVLLNREGTSHKKWWVTWMKLIRCLKFFNNSIKTSEIDNILQPTLVMIRKLTPNVQISGIICIPRKQSSFCGWMKCVWQMNSIW